MKITPFFIMLALLLSATAVTAQLTPKDSALLKQHGLQFLGKSNDGTKIVLLDGMGPIDTVNLASGVKVTVPTATTTTAKGDDGSSATDTTVTEPETRIPVEISGGTLWGAGAFTIGEARINRWFGGIYAQPDLGFTIAGGYRIVEGDLPVDVRLGYSFGNKFPVLAASTSRTINVWGYDADLRTDLSLSATEKIADQRKPVIGLLTQAPVRLWSKVDLGPALYLGWNGKFVIGGGIMGRYRFGVKAPQLPKKVGAVNLPNPAKDWADRYQPNAATGNSQLASAMPRLASLIVEDSTGKHSELTINGTPEQTQKTSASQTWKVVTDKGDIYVTLPRTGDGTLRKGEVLHTVRFSGVQGTTSFGTVTSSTNWKSVTLKFKP